MRLGADATLELLEYGDQIRTNEWRYKWSSVREELLGMLSQQNAFGPTYALARYYRSADKQEPDPFGAPIEIEWLTKLLDATGIRYRIKGRRKQPYSLWRKLEPVATLA